MAARRQKNWAGSIKPNVHSREHLAKAGAPDDPSRARDVHRCCCAGWGDPINATPRCKHRPASQSPSAGAGRGSPTSCRAHFPAACWRSGWHRARPQFVREGIRLRLTRPARSRPSVVRFATCRYSRTLGARRRLAYPIRAEPPSNDWVGSRSRAPRSTWAITVSGKQRERFKVGLLLLAFGFGNGQLAIKQSINDRARWSPCETPR